MYLMLEVSSMYATQMLFGSGYAHCFHDKHVCMAAPTFPPALTDCEYKDNSADTVTAVGFNPLDFISAMASCPSRDVALLCLAACEQRNLAFRCQVKSKELLDAQECIEKHSCNLRIENAYVATSCIQAPWQRP
jgi:hypothetical protein